MQNIADFLLFFVGGMRVKKLTSDVMLLMLQILQSQPSRRFAKNYIGFANSDNESVKNLNWTWVFQLNRRRIPTTLAFLGLKMFLFLTNLDKHHDLEKFKKTLQLTGIVIRQLYTNTNKLLLYEQSK